LSYYVTYFNSKAHDFEKYKDQSKSMTDKHNFAREHLPLLSYQYYLAYLLYNNCDKVLPSVARNTFAALSVSSTADAWSKVIKENVVWF
jgi:hypothetical protein